jgi:SAM-dependent methyltransferase
MASPVRRSLAIVSSLLLLLAVLPLGAFAQTPDTIVQSVPPPESVTSDEEEKDVPYVPTVKSVVRQMLETANVTEDDVVYDLGSGDGRIPIMAAKEFGARGVGIEIDSALVAKARQKAKAAGVADQVEFRQMDFFNVDLNDATVVTLYLWPEINIKLRPKLLEDLDPGDRIVSHDFRMGEWQPERRVDAGKGNTGRETVYLWTVPETVPEDLMDISDEPVNE